MKKDRITLAFEKWKSQSSESHITAICKPCWELKYCPYGSLVEYFPLPEEESPYRCRVFGHMCPVFKVAEPLTETKSLRNISRTIPQPVKFKVLRRDNGVCQVCGNNVSDEKINFDHTIPWSKGGSSDANNIRLLCEPCNKKRGNDFESEYLISRMQEVFSPPQAVTDEQVHDLLRLFYLAQCMKQRFGRLTQHHFCTIIQTDDIATDEFMYFLIAQLEDIFSSDSSFIPVKKKMNILKYRWGVSCKKTHSVNETCQKLKIEPQYYIEQENLLLRQIGFVMKKEDALTQGYLNMNINCDEVDRAFLEILSQLTFTENVEVAK